MPPEVFDQPVFFGLYPSECFRRRGKNPAKGCASIPGQSFRQPVRQVPAAAP